MTAIDEYHSIVSDLLSEIAEKEKESIKRAANEVADRVASKNIIHIFGPGHGRMAAEEMFARAGGLAPVNAILDSSLTVSRVMKDIAVEQIEGYTPHNLDYYDVRKEDILIVVHLFGVEPASIDIATEAKNRGITVIGITSADWCNAIPLDSPMRHSSKKNLSEISDVFIDTHVPPGDAVIEIEGIKQKAAPVSTIAEIFVINSIVAQSARILAERGIEPPIFKSICFSDAEEINKKFLDECSDRLKEL